MIFLWFTVSPLAIGRLSDTRRLLVEAFVEQAVRKSSDKFSISAIAIGYKYISRNLFWLTENLPWNPLASNLSIEELQGFAFETRDSQI